MFGSIRKRFAAVKLCYFIHIPKNGGVAIRLALKDNPNIVLSNPYHLRVVDYDSPESKSFFAVIRNPWSRVASRFYYAKQKCAEWPISDPRRMYVEKASFENFVLEAPSFEIPEHPGKPWLGPFANWYNQLSWVSDHQHVLAASIMRFEYLELDLSRYLGKRTTVKKRNVTKIQNDYRRLFNSRTVDAVAMIHKEDIATFGFSFDGSATRNIFNQ